MAIAITGASRLQDLSDVNVTPAAGVDEYALCWDNDTAKFVLRAVTTGGPYLPLAGGTLTGVLVSANGALGTPSIAFAANTKVGFFYSSNGVSLSLGSGGGTEFVFNSGAFSPPVRITGINGSAASPAFSFVADGDTGMYRGTSGNELGLATGGVARIFCDDTGYVGVGTITPATQLHALLTSAATNAVTNVLTIGHDTSGAAAAGFGAGQLFTLESSTTAEQSAALISVLWNDATHATRKADLVLSAYDTAEREGLRIRGAGAAAAIGFFGHAPGAQPAAYTPSNVSADRAFDADTVAVAELADVVGTLIADLQSLGLVA